MCILIEDLQINHVKSVWSWEVSWVLPSLVLPNVSHFWNRNIMLLSVPLEDVKWIPKPIICGLYVVKI